MENRNETIVEKESHDIVGAIKWQPLVWLYAVPLAIISLIAILWISWSHTSYDLEAFANRSRIQYSGSFARDFNDLNDVQMVAARAIGISPLASRDEAGSLSRKLRHIESNDLFVVEDLTHSIPYLVPAAADLLEDIGSAFTAKLHEENLPSYRPIVTSVTRTAEDIKRLRKTNVNSVENSTHLYATTFDITWKRFHRDHESDPRELSADELKHLLAQVLADLRKEGRCYVKHERLQSCFHITARK